MKRSGREGRWADIPSARARFALEAAFLIVVAAGAALAKLSPQAIIGLMLVAWLLVALIERASSREQAKAAAEPEEAPALLAEAAEREPYRWLFWRRRREAAKPLAAPTAPLEERPSRAHVRRLEPEPEPVAQADAELTEILAAETLAAEPVVTKRPLDLPGLEEAEPEPEPEPEPVAAAVPEPPPEPAPVEPPPPPAPEPMPAPVLRAPAAPPPAPREWNLWELERRAREQAGDAARDEEWSALFVHLRQFATAEGVLPREFDELVRESFAELIQAA